MSNGQSRAKVWRAFWLRIAIHDCVITTRVLCTVSRNEAVQDTHVLLMNTHIRIYGHIHPVLCISLEGLQPDVCCVVTCKASSIRARERHVARPTGALLTSMQARDLRRIAYAVAWVSSC